MGQEEAFGLARQIQAEGAPYGITAAEVKPLRTGGPYVVECVRGTLRLPMKNPGEWTKKLRLLHEQKQRH